MSTVSALALRRMLLLLSGLVATTGSHAFAVGELAVGPWTVVVWGMLMAMAALCGGRRRFRARGVFTIGAILIAAQTLLHVILVVAPWAIGLGPPHHDVAPIDARAMVYHTIVALLLAVLLRRADLLLAALTGVAEIVRRVVVAIRGRRTGSEAFGRPVVVLLVPRSLRVHRPRTSRGPPPTLRIVPI